MNPEAKNFEIIKRMRDAHDNGGCPYGKPATTVAMHPVDIERMGWEAGETVCGLSLLADPTIGSGVFWILCDGDLDGEPVREEEKELALV